MKIIINDIIRISNRISEFYVNAKRIKYKERYGWDGVFNYNDYPILNNPQLNISLGTIWHSGKDRYENNCVSIHDRPAEVDGKRFGDWGMDLIVDSHTMI